MKGDTALLVHLTFFDTGPLGKPVVTRTPFGSPDLTALAYVIGTAILTLLPLGLFIPATFDCFLLFPTLCT